MYKENVVVLFSGGMGSFLSANMIREVSPESKIALYFNDTFLERPDLYRFITDTVNYLFPNPDMHHRLLAKAFLIPRIDNATTREDLVARKAKIIEWGNSMMISHPQFVYDPDGRDVWELFEDSRYIGNPRVDLCSRVLKRDRSSSWVKKNFDIENTDVAIGIDWTEKHRYDRAKNHWDFNIIAPLIDAMIDKSDYEYRVLRSAKIRRSEAYELGLAHDNCGGFCVKAGIGHFKMLLEKEREKYLYHERRLEEVMQVVGRHPFLLKQVANSRTAITLREFREYMETGELRIDEKLILVGRIRVDELDFGGCGCAI